MPYAKKNTYVLSTIYGDALDDFRNAVGNYWELGPYFPQYGDPGSRNNSALIDKKINKINTFKIIPRQKKKKSLKKYPFLKLLIILRSTLIKKTTRMRQLGLDILIGFIILQKYF